MASIQGKLKEIDGWLRNRLRYCIWHHWNRNELELKTEGSNKPERKRKNLIRLCVEQEMAYQWSRRRMGGWAIAQRRSPHEYHLKDKREMSKALFWELQSPLYV